MKIKSRMAAALTAVFLCLPVFTLPAYAQSTEPAEEPPAQEETTTAKPFTPEGTGTVVDNATDDDGKEFYTIQTLDEHVFFLVIDKQRTSENVYFLDADRKGFAFPRASGEGARNGRAGTKAHNCPAGAYRRTEARVRPEARKGKQPCGDNPSGAGRGGDWRRGRLVLQDLPPETSGPGFGRGRNEF